MTSHQCCCVMKREIKEIFFFTRIVSLSSFNDFKTSAHLCWDDAPEQIYQHFNEGSTSQCGKDSEAPDKNHLIWIFI